jgi:sugar (pentulose or hexulose) kinase
VAHALGADRVSEPSLASRTGLLDQATGKQWPEALALLGVDSLLPDLLPAGHSAGVVKPGPGVPEGLVGATITVVGHDHPVAAAGVGATGDHELFNSCGTADVLLRNVPRPLTDDERETLVTRGIDAGRHVLNGQSVLIGGIRAGLVMRRVLAMLGADDPSGRARLDMLTGDPRRIVVTGARSTDQDVTVTLTDDATPAAVWSAALAHISEVTESLLHGVNDVVGAHHAAVAAGGWTRMSSVRNAKKRLLPELRFSSLAQPGAFGAALFAAWAAAGNPGGPPSSPHPRSKRMTLPAPTLAARNRTSGERDANQPQVRDQTEPSVLNATNTLNSGEAGQL